ncbi:DUF3613 domain-containing protein [Pseudomonas sp. RA_35y_Pfl2_P32]|uniref:DUF3613 domain-containing protein n=1 Tax=Pseudomonas sp. RA_35y_Pfl2_P32 TaxID=3088705 RepID=UPI0030DB95C1
MKLATVACLVLLGLPLSAVAIESGPASAQQQETEGWLVLQSSNKAASTTPQTATATERELALQRWLKKFSYTIPDLYDQDSAGELSSGN